MAMEEVEASQRAAQADNWLVPQPIYQTAAKGARRASVWCNKSNNRRRPSLRRPPPNCPVEEAARVTSSNSSSVTVAAVRVIRAAAVRRLCPLRVVVNGLRPRRKTEAKEEEETNGRRPADRPLPVHFRLNHRSSNNSSRVNSRRRWVVTSTNTNIRKMHRHRYRRRRRRRRRLLSLIPSEFIRARKPLPTRSPASDSIIPSATFAYDELN